MSEDKVIAGVDVGNATTEVVIAASGRLLGADRLPTRGRKGSAESLRGAAALVRRLERRLGCTVDEARTAPLRAADTATLAIPPAPPATGRLRVLAAGVATPGGNGVCVGVPLWLDRPAPAATASHAGPAAHAGPAQPTAAVAIVPEGFGYARAADRLRALIASGVPVGAVLAGGDEGVLIANRLPASLPVIDQVDTGAVAGCAVVAVEVRAAGQPVTLLADPVALGAALSLTGSETGDVTALCRSLVDYSNAVVGHAAEAPAGGSGAGQPGEPWVLADGARVPLREACSQLLGWPVGAVRAFGSAAGATDVEDLFAMDLAAVADTATARRQGLRRGALAAWLLRMTGGDDHAAELAELLERPAYCLLTEPAAARLGALTTPGATPDAVVVDVGAGTIDVITPGDEVVAAGAGDLLTAAVAAALGITRAAADWVKRGPCVRVDGGQRFEAEDGTRGFLGRPAPASAAGMLAVAGPAGLLPFDRAHTPAEWRAIRLRLKQAVFAANLRRALGSLGRGMPQVIIVGGPAGDDEMLGVLLRSLPGGVAVGRGNVGGTLASPGTSPSAGSTAGRPAGHRYAAALGLALAPGPLSHHRERARLPRGSQMVRHSPRHVNTGRPPPATPSATSSSPSPLTSLHQAPPGWLVR